MDIYRLWWIEQHIKDYKKRYNDYKPKKACVKFVQTAAKKEKVPVVEYVSHGTLISAFNYIFNGVNGFFQKQDFLNYLREYKKLRIWFE